MSVDPIACLLACTAALAGGDIPTLRARMYEYATWIRTGGYEPLDIPGTELPGNAYFRELLLRQLQMGGGVDVTSVPVYANPTEELLAAEIIQSGATIRSLRARIAELESQLRRTSP